MPSLSSFSPREKPGCVALDDESRDAAGPGADVRLGINDVDARFRAVGDPHLAAIEQ